jgi:hypothetical protein
LGQKEAAEKGAQAGALAGERAGVQAGAAAGAVAARKAATAVAMKTLAEALRNITLQTHVVNMFATNGSAASASANVNVNGMTGASASGQGKAGGNVSAKQASSGGGTGTGTGAGTGTGTGSGTTGSGPNLPVVEPKPGESIEHLAKTFRTENGAASTGKSWKVIKIKKQLINVVSSRYEFGISGGRRCPCYSFHQCSVFRVFKLKVIETCVRGSL